MDTWTLLRKELDYYGIKLIDNKKCQFCDDNGNIKIQGVIKAVRIMNKYAKKQKELLLLLWGEVVETLQEPCSIPEIIDDNMMNLFVFSLKDMVK